jgi:hypothetical protein
MSNHAVMPYQHYKDACDAIRAKGAGSAYIKSGDMAAAINSISSGSAALPDISFTHLHDCPPLDKKDNDYFGENVRTYLTNQLSQPGDLLLIVLSYIGATTMRLNIPTVNNWTVNGYEHGISIIAGISTPEMVPLFNTKLTQDLAWELDNDLHFFRIRGCRLFSSVVSGSGRINGGSKILLSNGGYRVPRGAIFGVAFSNNADRMLTDSVNVADNDVFKHIFSTFEFDSHGTHMKSAFFGTIKQSKTAMDDTMRLTITNPRTGEYSYMKTGVFY